MKKTVALLAITGLLAVGCRSTDYYGSADDARFSTPSWGAASGWEGYQAPGGSVTTTADPDPMGGTTTEFEDMTPSADINHGTQPQMPPTESGSKDPQDDFGPQRR
jgi:hypothetical protein